MGGAAHLISTAPFASVRIETLGDEQPTGRGAGAGVTLGGVACGGLGACDGPPVAPTGGAVGGLGICDGPPVVCAGGAGMAGAFGVRSTGGGGMDDCGIDAPMAAICGSSSMSAYWLPSRPSHAVALEAANATAQTSLMFMAIPGNPVPVRTMPPRVAGDNWIGAGDYQLPSSGQPFSFDVFFMEATPALMNFSRTFRSTSSSLLM